MVLRRCYVVVDVVVEGWSLGGPTVEDGGVEDGGVEDEEEEDEEEEDAEEENENDDDGRKMARGKKRWMS